MDNIFVQKVFMDKVIPKEFRGKFEEAKDDLTRSPQVNELIKVAGKVKEGKVDKEELRDPINKLYDTYDALVSSYKALLPTQPKTKDLEIKAKLLSDAFEGFRNALDEITLYFKEEDAIHLDYGLKLLKNETDLIMKLIDDFKAEEKKVKTYSQSPEINELIRIGKGIIKGDFKPAYLRPRYEIAKNIYEDTFSNVTAITEKEPDTEALKKQTPIILEALNLFKEGLEKLEEYFNLAEKTEEKGELLEIIEVKGKDIAPEPEEIREGEEKTEESEKAEEVREEVINPSELLDCGLDSIQKASGLIYDAQMALRAEIEELSTPTVRCPRCAHKVPANARYCKECRARIPEMPVAGSTIEIKDRSPLEQQDQVMVPPHIKKVYDAAFEVHAGKITKEDFEKELDWLKGKMTENRDNMDELLKTPKGIDKKEEEFFEKVKKTVIEGVKNCLDGIEEMRLYIKDDEKTHLETGLAMIMKGGTYLYGVREVGRKAQAEQKKTGKKDRKSVV